MRNGFAQAMANDAGDDLDDELRFANEDIEARAEQLLQADQDAKVLTQQLEKLREERERLDTFLELEEMKRMLLATVSTDEDGMPPFNTISGAVQKPTEAWAAGTTDDTLDAARADALLAIDDDDDVDAGGIDDADVRQPFSCRM